MLYDYDLSSSYLERRCCVLGEIGYSRDGQGGKMQITCGAGQGPFGDRSGRVRRGPRDDHRGSNQGAHRAGVGFITSLGAPQIQALRFAPNFQLSLFDV